MPIDWGVVQPYENKSLEEMLAQRSLAPEIQQGMQLAGLQQHGQEVEEQIAARKQAAAQHEADLEETRKQREAYQASELANRSDALMRSKYSALTGRLQPQIEKGVQVSLDPQEKQIIDQVEGPSGYTEQMDVTNPDHPATKYIYHKEQADIAKAQADAIKARQELQDQNTKSEMAARDHENKLRDQANERANTRLSQSMADNVAKLKGLTPEAAHAVEQQYNAWLKANPRDQGFAGFGGENEDAYDARSQAQFQKFYDSYYQNPMNRKPGSTPSIPGITAPPVGGGRGAAPTGGGNVPPPAGAGPSPQQLYQQYLTPKKPVVAPGGGAPPPQAALDPAAMPPTLAPQVPGLNLPLMGALANG